jgi:transposase
MIGAWSEQRWRKARDLPIAGKPVWLEIRQRRFRSPKCRKRFWEQFQSVLLRQRQTRRFQAHLVMSLKGSSVSKISRDNEAGYRVVERLYLKEIEERHSPERGRCPASWGCMNTPLARVNATTR